jgi:hypothetical protein
MATSTLGSGTLVLAGTTSGTTTVTATAVAGTTTLTLPAATDTLVGKATTDTLTNKTLTGAAMNGTLGATTPSTVAATTISASSTATFAAGAAGTPSITTTGDTNTGLFFPAADTIAFAEGGAESMRLDSSGNLGLGVTPSAWGSSVKAIQIGARTGVWNLSDNTYLSTNSYFDGTNSRYIGTQFATMYSQQNDGAHKFYVAPSGTAGNAITFTQAMTLDASGNLLVGTTSAVASERLNVTGSVATGFVSRVINQNATSPQGMLLYYSGASPNSSGAPFLYCLDTTTLRAEIRSNGGLANYSANNVNLSDERSKTDIQNAGNYLAKICAIPIRTFKYKDQTDDLLNLGVIAQEVEAIAPELVDVSGFGETPEDGIPLKAIYQTDLQYALMKCIQEQQALITQLTARITALESA